MLRIRDRIFASALSATAIGLAWSNAWAADAAKQDPAPTWFTYTVIAFVLVGILIAILCIRGALGNSTWSISDALSEEADVTAMIGPPDAPRPFLDASQKPVTISQMRASSSRLIALMGMIVILFMFIGFGTFSMYYFAQHWELPDSIDEVVKFLLAGLTLFAPYVVNKFSSLFEGLSPRR